MAKKITRDKKNEKLVNEIYGKMMKVAEEEITNKLDPLDVMNLFGNLYMNGAVSAILCQCDDVDVMTAYIWSRKFINELIDEAERILHQTSWN